MIKLDKEYTVYVSSSDAYSDIWDLFFDLFKKYWSGFDGQIVLNTETKSYHRPDLNIVCTQVGELGAFGKTFRAGLDKIATDAVLLIMIDYIFMGDVDVRKLDAYFNFFQSNDLDSLCLAAQYYPNRLPSQQEDLVLVHPPAPNVMFSYQVAFWKKAVLREMALPHENPWMSEWFGTRRAEKMRIKLAAVKTKRDAPITYDLKGCLHQGKWLQNAVDFLNGIQYHGIDFSRRGIYTNEYQTLLFRFKLKYTIWKTGLKGSYWDLIKR
ncbi:MAG: hypothetical protein QM610_05115 [Chitinophagaceae bacterium]